MSAAMLSACWVVLADLFKQVLQQQAPAGAGSGHVACWWRCLLVSALHLLAVS